MRISFTTSMTSSFKPISSALTSIIGSFKPISSAITSRTGSVLLRLLCLALAGLIFSSVPGTLSVAWAESPQQQGDTGAGPSREAMTAKHFGDIYSKNGAIQKAIEAYEQAIHDYPAYAEVYYLLGLIYDLQEGNLEKAIACYQKFLELSPNAPETRDVHLLLESAKQALAPSSSTASNASAPATAPPATAPPATAPPATAPPATAQASLPSSPPAAAASEETNVPAASEETKVPVPAASEKTTVPAAPEDPSVPAAAVPEEINVQAAAKVESSDSHEIVKSSDVRNEMRASDVSKIDRIGKRDKVSPSKKSEPLSGFPSSEQFISRSIDEKVLKYSIKLAVWQREGYIQKFNELALARGSSLTNNISEERAQLREERQKATEFINYAKEAEYFLLQQMINDLLKEWGMDLPELPQKLDLQKAAPSCQVMNIQEDKKYVQVLLNVKIDVQNLKEQLLKLGYQFTPVRIQLECSNLYGEFKDRFLEAVQRKSGYMKSQSEGLYEIYAPAELVASELSKMMIGTYGIHLDSVEKDKIIFTAESREK